MIPSLFSQVVAASPAAASRLNIGDPFHFAVRQCVFAMVGAAMMVQGVWKKPGVWNMEQFDPDPFLAELAKRGLPWTETWL